MRAYGLQPEKLGGSQQLKIHPTFNSIGMQPELGHLISLSGTTVTHILPALSAVI